MARREPVYMYNARPLDHGISASAKTISHARGTIRPVEPATKEDFVNLTRAVSDLDDKLMTQEDRIDYAHDRISRCENYINKLREWAAQMEQFNASHRGGSRIVIKKGRNTVNIKLR